MGSRAQASLEYAFVVGLVILMTLPIFIYSRERYNSNVAATAVDDAVKLIIDTADSVAMAGPGTARTVWITLPGGVQSTEVSGRHVSVTFSLAGRETEIHGLSIANLTGTMPSSAGTHPVRVEMQDTVVSISP
jgi:hypothetical protein